MAEEKSASSDILLNDRRHTRGIKRTFLLPAVFYLLLFSIFPLIWSLVISFTDYGRGGGAATQAEVAAGADVGFLALGFNVTVRNYARLVQDPRLYTRRATPSPSCWQACCSSMW